MNSTVFSDVLIYILLRVYRRRGGPYLLRLQRRASNKQAATRIFDPEDGGSMFLRIADKLLSDYMA
jgi:hypothetical protein